MKIHRHDGGDCPVSADASVVVQFRSGMLSGASLRDGLACAPIRAGDYRWNAWPNGPGSHDIVRWRFADEQAERDEEARLAALYCDRAAA